MLNIKKDFHLHLLVRRKRLFIQLLSKLLLLQELLGPFTWWGSLPSRVKRELFLFPTCSFREDSSSWNQQALLFDRKEKAYATAF